jgi:hypothetical protein
MNYGRSVPVHRNPLRRLRHQSLIETIIKTIKNTAARLNTINDTVKTAVADAGAI